MPINVSEALDADFCLKLQVERDSPGSYVDGIYVGGGTSTFNSLISPQQPTAKQLQVLPEGERQMDIMLFISKRPLKTVDDRAGTKADIVTYNGDRYRIIKLADWSTFGHTIAFGARDET